MRRTTYVDKNGNTINQSLEQKKPLLKLFFVIGTILPLVVIGFIIYQVNINNKCSKVYDSIETAASEYLQNRNSFPNIDGDSITINLSNLYRDTLSSSSTLDTLASGSVKVTKYNDTYIYTLDIKNCDVCSTDTKYGAWSNKLNSYPSGKTIVDVIPYYNYYNRELNTTAWSDYYEEEELSEEESEYGIKLPIDESTLPQIPNEGNIYNIESDSIYYYRYRTKTWRWYDIEGDYSEYSSEKPDGYRNRDDNTAKYTEWSEYSLNYPEEKSYRTIQNVTGYKYYYEDENGNKVYYNDGNYASSDEVDHEKYNKRDSDSATIYRYRDQEWRWYNGTQRRYSNYSSTAPSDRPYRDDDTETLSSPTSWSEESRLNSSNQDYIIEERKLMTRFRVQYEFLSLKVLQEPLTQKDFEEEVGMTLAEFNNREDVKLDVTYKFKYRKTS